MVTLPMFLSTGKIDIPAINAYGLISDETELRNPFGGAMLVDEIRFWLYSSLASNYGLNMFAAEIRLGRAPLMNDPIPITLMNRKQVSEVTAVSDYLSSFFKAHAVTYRPPRPILVPRNVLLRIKIKNLGYTAGGSTDYISVGYAVRSLPDNFVAPARIAVPWFAHYKIAPSAATTTPLKSTAVDLANPSAKYPLRVTRFTARDIKNSATGASSFTDFYTDNKIKIFDHLGNPIVRDYMPLLKVVEPDLSWPIKFDIPPRQAVHAQVTATAAITWLELGMQGWREVDITEVIQ